jgi:hypothetical protein
MQLHYEIDDFFAVSVSRFTHALANLAEKIGPEAPPKDGGLAEELTERIHESLAECAQFEKEIADEPDLLKAVQRRYREAIWPWFGQSWFMRRALEKPRGYPGDYELLTAIYDGQTKSLGLGGYFDRYFLNTTLAKAVVSRLYAVRDFLMDELAQRSGDVYVLNVASGACREYALDFQPTNHRRVGVTCIDNDASALEFVRTCVAPQLHEHVNFSFARYNALRMVSPEQNVKRFGRPDILYSVGLCDYIPDKFLVPMLRAWRESVSENGVVYVAFKDAELYDKSVYQWLVDWYFFQRTEEECRQLFIAAGYHADLLGKTRDETRVIINFIGRAAAVPVRVDGSEPLPRAPQQVPDVTTSDVAGVLSPQ